MAQNNSKKKAHDAILGQLVTVSIQGPGGPEPIGEFDKADWKVVDELKHRKPLGFKLRRHKLLVQAWEGSMERGKIDKNIIQAIKKEWEAVMKGELEPRYSIDITNTYYDGTEEVHRFREVILHDVNWMSNGADEFVEEKIKWTAEDYQLE
jgi:hypothetical protein